MKKYIEQLQNRSYAEKSNVAFFTSLILTGLIATVWFLTIFADPSGYFNPKEAEVQNLANTGSLFDVFREGIK